MALSAYFQNATAIEAAIAEVGVDRALACAVVEKETNGRHVYGNDTGGVFSTPGAPDLAVTAANFAEFERRVLAGEKSNGVGIMQITYAGPKRADGTRDGGFFRVAREQGLDLSGPRENVVFGLGLVRDYLKAAGGVPTQAAVEAVGKRYNGATTYGASLWLVYQKWVARLAAETPAPVVPAPIPEPTPAPVPTPEPAPVPAVVELSPASIAALVKLAASLDGMTAALNRVHIA